MTKNNSVAYNPALHHRRSIRLKGYDYSRSGFYFITLCVQDRLCLFGNIENTTLTLNQAGGMVKKWWHELSFKYPHIQLHGYIVMPNHFHGIIEIHYPQAQTVPEPVGADLRVCPCRDIGPEDGPTHGAAPAGCHFSGNMQEGGHAGPPLQTMVQWFKTMTTNGYIHGVNKKNWQRFNKKLWQRNYYEHIIRSEKSYLEISEYIQTNPLKWKDDTYYEPDQFRKNR